MAMNQRIKKGLDEVQAQAEVDKEWWEKRRASISDEFMKELDAEGPTRGPASNKATSKGSDEDEAVLVESGGPEVQHGQSKKKKKGKK
jgi:translocation protein SEC66